jgi:outer membrane receptor protein involved in Fe transport
MGPNRSLLLVNGRRVADYPLPYGGETNFSNYGNIPAAAVERIEVLTGGASAIYGSDAIAGVVNVILKTNYDGDEVRVRGGTSTEGGRDTWDLSWAGGKTGDNWA